MKTKEIPIDQISEPAYDVRTTILKEGLDELAASIQAVGVLQPLRVFADGSRYEIEDGHRRYLAAKMINLKTLPCLIVESEEDKRELKKLHANIHSASLTAIELSRTLHYLKDKFAYSQEELGRLMGVTQGRINQLLALINYEPDIVEAMEDGKLSEHLGRQLNQIKNPDKRKYYTRYALDGGATLDVVKSWVAREKIEETQPQPPVWTAPDTPPDQSPIVVRQRCGCCKSDFDPQTLLIIRLCGECYADLTKIMPDIYKAMRQERHG